MLELVGCGLHVDLKLFIIVFHFLLFHDFVLTANILSQVQASWAICSFGGRADSCPASWGLDFYRPQQPVALVFCICKVFPSVYFSPMPI